MSECKKTCGNCAGRIESILSKDRCDMTRNTIENYSNTCNHWEPNRETEIVMQKDELKSLRQERDSLQAQVAVLRGALETATDYLYNPFEPDNQCAQYKNIKNILPTTPAEGAERVQKLAEASEAWEKWEAEIIMDDGCWEPGGMAVLPTMTKAIYEKMIKLQEVRNEALSEWRRDK